MRPFKARPKSRIPPAPKAPVRPRRSVAETGPNPKRIWFSLGFGLWVLGFVVAQPSVNAAGRLVMFRAADGRTLTGLLLEAEPRPSAAVVLVPMLGRSRDDWQLVAQRLADASITALAIDLPGDVIPAEAAALTAWHEDIGAAVAFLASRPADVRAGAIGIAGASLGANLAAVAAAADPGIRSIALVSPSLDYRGVRIEESMRAYGARPALLMSSLQDPYSARSVRALAQGAPGPRELRWSIVPAHGTLLLQRDADFIRSLVEWFQLTLG
jgi:dienelactone hydrolase